MLKDSNLSHITQKMQNLEYHFLITEAVRNRNWELLTNQTVSTQEPTLISIDGGRKTLLCFYNKIMLIGPQS